MSCPHNPQLQPYSAAEEKNPTDASPRTGLHFRVAHTLEEVLEAWELTYKMYLRGGLINPNPTRIHTVSQAIGPNTAVICGRIDSLTVSTLTIYADSQNLLPLDVVYRNELQELRRNNGALFELGLFADRRDGLVRSIEALLELMRFACYFAVHNKGDKNAVGVIGVHPHHVQFYTRLLGFSILGPEKQYPTVKNNPVVLLSLNWNEKMHVPDPPRGLAHLMNNPLPPDTFAPRYLFPENEVQSSRIHEFFHPKHPDPTPLSEPAPR